MVKCACLACSREWLSCCSPLVYRKRLRRALDKGSVSTALCANIVETADRLKFREPVTGGSTCQLESLLALTRK